MWLRTLEQARRLFKILVGATLVLMGVVMLVTPGPGWLTIILGLAMLGAEFVWARRLLHHLKSHGNRIKDSIFNGRKSPSPSPPGSRSAR